jgi:hypothetical protein
MTTLMEHYRKCKNNREDITTLYLSMKTELQSYIEEERSLEKYLEKNYICSSKVPYVASNYLPVIEDLREYHLSNSLCRLFYSNTIKKLYDKIAPRVFHTFPDARCIMELERYFTLSRLIQRLKEDLRKFYKMYNHLIDYNKRIAPL